MKNLIIVFLVICSLLHVGCESNSEAGNFTLANCPVSVPQELIDSGKFTFGFIKVPEFYKKPKGKTIELAVAVFKCMSDSASQPPLVVCAGGPGSSNIDTFVPLFAYEIGGLFLENRDVVIIESRGLKYSNPYLGIPELEEVQLSLLDKNLTADETIDLYLEILQSTYKRFKDEGINLSAYNAMESANEIAYIMNRFGYDKFSFFGTSYGTMVAQLLMLNHSNQLTSVIMNGTMDVNLGGYHMHTSMIKYLESIFQDCQNIPELSSAYPDLKSRFLQLIKNLNTTPVEISAKYGVNNELYKILLNGNRLSVWLFNQMYTNTQIPLTLHKILSGDYSDIINSPGSIFPLHDFSMGLSLSFFLSETPDIRSEHIPIDGEYADLVRGCGTSMFFPYFWEKAQGVWKVERRDDKKSIKTDVPILMFAGKMDYLCLPSYAIEFSEQQKNAYLNLFDGVAHSPIDAGPCAIMMLKEFIEDPTKAPDNSCVKEFKHEYLLPNL